WHPAHSESRSIFPAYRHPGLTRNHEYPATPPVPTPCGQCNWPGHRYIFRAGSTEKEYSDVPRPQGQAYGTQTGGRGPDRPVAWHATPEQTPTPATALKNR